MRKPLLLLALILFVVPGFAARRVSISELEQTLTRLHGKPDAEQAYRIAELELSERLSAARLKQLQESVPGDQSRQALLALADASAFQDPPAAELPPAAAPDLAEQKRIMGLVVAYVGKTIPQLPNFIATRATTRFEDTPQIQRPDGLLPYQPLHPVGSSRATTLYRDGREVDDPEGGQGKKPAAVTGLKTWGEFGPILGIVLVDAARSRLVWSHWEEGSSGPLAVFHYEVPRERSHYEVTYCCITEERATTPDLLPFHKIVDYHGEIAADPATGAILRITIESEMKVGDPVQMARLLVEYGPVEIGGRSYICPQRSVSVSLAESLQFSERYLIPEALQLHPQKTMLNHVVFEDYHLFRAEARIIPGGAGAEVAAAEKPQPPTAPAAAAPAASLAP
ncbi:MAG: hypothetical protein WCE75_15920, partial [Terracidiphilus sp.]